MNVYQYYLLKKQQEEAENQNRLGSYFRGQANNLLNQGIQNAAKDFFANKVAPAIANKAVGAITDKLASPLVSSAANSIGPNIAANVASNLAGNIAGNAVGKFAGGTVGNLAGNVASNAVGNIMGGATANTAGNVAGSTLANTATSTAGNGALASAGPWGWVAALALTALQGTNRKRAKSTSNNLMESTNQASEQGISQAENMNNLAGQEANNLVAQNLAKAVQPLQIDYGQQATKNTYNPLTDMPTYLQGKGYPNDVNYNSYSEPQQGQVAENVQQNNEKQGFLDNVINGIIDFSRGYQENANNAFRPENLNAQTFALNNDSFKQSINPEDYRTKLNADEQTQFNNWVDSMRQSGAIAKDDKFNDYDMQGYWKNEVLNNTDLANGNAQNHFTDKYKMPNHKTFSNESIYATGDNAKYAGYWDGDKFVAPQVEKNKMGRLGEAAGTISRVLQKPGVQAAIAGGISTALTGNPLYGAGMAYKFGNAKTMDKVYRDVLGQYGYNVPEVGPLGNISSNDMRNIGSMAETNAWHDYLKLKNAEELARKTSKDEADKELKEKKLEADTSYKAKKLEIDKIKATNKGNGRGNGGGKTAPKGYGQFVIGETPNGERVRVPVEKAKEFKSYGGKIVG